LTELRRKRLSFPPKTNKRKQKKEKKKERGKPPKKRFFASFFFPNLSQIRQQFLQVVFFVLTRRINSFTLVWFVS
jgi:hypothetical protein